MTEWDEDEDIDQADEEASPPNTAAVKKAELYFGSVDDFVRNFLIHAYKRPINGHSRLWARQWWKYDEAVMRLEALWRAWEHLRLDPSLGMSTWWRDHADPHMRELMDPDGPFAELVGDRDNSSSPGQPLPYEAPPEHLFPDVRTIEE